MYEFTAINLKDCDEYVKKYILELTKRLRFLEEDNLNLQKLTGHNSHELVRYFANGWHLEAPTPTERLAAIAAERKLEEHEINYLTKGVIT